MQLNTEIAFGKLPSLIDYHSSCVFSGSCFSANIGEWLSELKFDVATNVCGISYNPSSIANHILLALSGKEVNEIELLKSRDQFVHPDFHSTFNAATATETLSKINQGISDYRDALRKCDFFFITFGTAIGFQSELTHTIVNNCHHLPSNNFTKRMMSEDELFNGMTEALELLISQNPEVQLIFTVSPIRHLRQGGIGNIRSKARLILLCEKLEKHFSKSTYLPVYEYVMDDLRDYRYYRQDDLIHLNELGINLIREKVRDAAISAEAYPLMKRIEKWNRMNSHRVQNRESAEFNTFNKKLSEETPKLKELLPDRF